MKLRINGEDREVDKSLSIWQLLIHLELEPSQSGIAVAVNREVVPRTKWKKTELPENCDVEIIRAVQGG